LPKFKEKVQTIYIDPPFNLESSDQFLYRTNYKDSTWATLLENRLRLAKDWLNEKGSIFVRCDYNGKAWIVRCLMNEIFGKENFRNEISDFFLGSGTTTSVAHKLGRKWIGVEMGNYFDTDILFRMKQVLCGYGKNEPCGISKEIDWQGGGFFKYYELEQYEETLANTVYENHDMLIVGNKSVYEQYVFMKDEKMLRALEIDYKNNKVKVDLSKLYENIDIAETLSNLTGKWIKRINYGEVEFEDGTKVNTKDLDYRLIKPLIWWE
jgi:hypothetical protein